MKQKRQTFTAVFHMPRTVPGTSSISEFITVHLGWNVPLILQGYYKLCKFNICIFHMGELNLKISCMLSFSSIDAHIFIVIFLLKFSLRLYLLSFTHWPFIILVLWINHILHKVLHGFNKFFWSSTVQLSRLTYFKNPLGVLCSKSFF